MVYFIIHYCYLSSHHEMCPLPLAFKVSVIYNLFFSGLARRRNMGRMTEKTNKKHPKTLAFKGHVLDFLFHKPDGSEWYTWSMADAPTWA